MQILFIWGLSCKRKNLIIIKTLHGIYSSSIKQTALAKFWTMQAGGKHFTLCYQEFFTILCVNIWAPFRHKTTRLLLFQCLPLTPSTCQMVKNTMHKELACHRFQLPSGSKFIAVPSASDLQALNTKTQGCLLHLDVMHYTQTHTHRQIHLECLQPTFLQYHSFRFISRDLLNESLHFATKSFASQACSFCIPQRAQLKLTPQTTQP